jgi:hypothetical protein
MDELNRHFQREAGEDPDALDAPGGDILDFPGVQLDDPTEDEGWQGRQIDEG